jgi:peptidyl-dipeptidase A
MSSKLPGLRGVAAALATAGVALAGCPSSSNRKYDVPPVVVPPAVVAPAEPGPAEAPPAGPTAEEAAAFVRDTDAGLRRVIVAEGRAQWINSTYITEDTDALAADAAQQTMEFTTGAIKASMRFAGLQSLPADVERQLTLLRRSPTLPSPGDAALRKELAELAVGMQSTYGKGTYCSKALAAWADKGARDACLTIGQLSKVLEDPRATWAQLQEAYTGWRTIAVPLKDDYARFVELGNQGARELGYRDVGDLWKSRYDMPTEAMEADVERLWQQVRPLYEKLHCYVRKELREKWGKDRIPNQTIPAHLFGNLWSQQWSSLYDVVAPFPKEASLDVTKAMVGRKLDAVAMTKLSEGFFVSLGMPKLPDTFWTRSMITKPRDREVVCHASAWDLTYAGDVRIKMCTEVNEDDLVTLHHELGHDYYFLAYADEPMLFQDGANDGFHEAIGDTIVLSMTPKYLADVGILDRKAAASNPRAELNLLMKRALDGVSFLPFGYLIDKWRWDVFSGKTPPDRYNAAWWELVRTYQGLEAPAPRGEEFFDPGAKYHVPANTPYLRYFLARIYQFQFHRSLCQAAGHTGPLHTCSIFNSKAAGEKLWAMLQLGSTRPWPDAMEAVTGQRQADASAILEYFAPLSAWLDESTRGEQCGW